MKVSASIIIALFCTALIINPIVLILLFSQATDEAISGMVSGWDSTALNTVQTMATTRSSIMLGLLELAALGVKDNCPMEFKDLNASSTSSSGSSGGLEHNASCLAVTLELYGSMIDSALTADGASEGGLGVARLLVLSTSLAAGAATDAFDNASVLFTVRAMDSASYGASTAGGSSGSCVTHGATATCDISSVVGAPVILHASGGGGAASGNTSIMLLGNSVVSWCSDAVSMAEDLIALSEVQSNRTGSGSRTTDTATIVTNSIEGALIALSAWAIAPITSTDYLLLVVTQPLSSTSSTSTTTTTLSCPTLRSLLPKSANSSLVSYLFASSWPTAVLGGLVVNVSSSSTITPTPLQPAPVGQAWMLSMVTGSSWASSTLLPNVFVLPRPFALLIVQHDVAWSPNAVSSSSVSPTVNGTSNNAAVLFDWVPTSIKQSNAISCTDVAGSTTNIVDVTAANSVCNVVALGSTSNVTSLLQRAYPSLVNAMVALTTAPCASSPSSNGSSAGRVLSSSCTQQTVFSEDTTNSVFLTSQWLMDPHGNTIRASTTTTITVTQRHLSLLLVVPSGSSRDLMSQSSSNSVIVSVSITALAFIATVAAMHFMFHPLKTIGSLLRGCADIQLHDLEHQAPSYLHEIFKLQQCVDRLVKRIRIIGRYMPDKSQLHTVLSQATDIQAFADTPAGTIPAGGDRKGNGRSRGTSSGFVGGGIAHSVSVRLEYRSRSTEDTESSPNFWGKLKKLARRFTTSDEKKLKLHRDVYHRKRSAFEFVYNAQGDMFYAFMQQTRERLGERVGEELKLFNKPSSASSSSNNAHISICTPITCDEELVDAIESCTNRTLHLVVIKASAKNFRVWALAVVSVVDVALLFNAAVHVMNTAASDLEVSEDTAVIVERAGIAIATIAALRLFFNTIASLYLVRALSGLYHPLSMWVGSALQEVLVSVLLSSASLGNIHLLFSQTRLTSALRFNAPYSDAHFRYRLFRWCLWSLILGDVLPLGLCIFAVGQLRGLELRTFFSVFFSSLMIVMFVAEHYVEAIALKLKLCFSGQDGFGGLRRRFSSSNGSGQSAIETDGVLLLKDPSTAVVPLNDDEADGMDLLEAAATSASSPLSGTTRAHNTADVVSPLDGDDAVATDHSAKRGTDVAPSLYLGLSKRAASVLRISLHCAAAHFDNMDANEIQTLCSSFLGAVFAETKAYGGIVLAVSNTDVTIGFNCHQVQANHFSRGLGCYFSIRHVVYKTIQEWCVDDRERPRVMGGLVTGEHIVVGFAGSGEARSFQLLGKTHRELDSVCRIGAWYSAALTCNEEAVKKIAEECGEGKSAATWWKQSFATAPGGLGSVGNSSDRMTMDTNVGGVTLFTRLIETVNDSIQEPQDAATNGSSPTTKKSLTFVDEPGTAATKLAAKAIKGGLTKIYEVLWEDGCEEMVNSSKTCLAFLERWDNCDARAGTVNHHDAAPALAGGRSPSRDDPVPLPELIRSHLLLFPKDTVVHAVLRRIVNSGAHLQSSAQAVGPRRRSVIGLDETLSELHSLSTSGDGREGDANATAQHAARASNNSGKPSTIFQRICTSDKYKLYFTEL